MWISVGPVLVASTPLFRYRVRMFGKMEEHRDTMENNNARLCPRASRLGILPCSGYPEAKSELRGSLRKTGTQS